MQELVANHPMYGNGGNGHAQTTQQVQRPDPAQLSTRNEQGNENPPIRIRSFEKDKYQAKQKTKRKCAECGTTKSHNDHWYFSKNAEKQGFVCSKCYFRQWRHARKKKEKERPLQAGMPQKLEALNSLFERQTKLLTEKQGAIKNRLIEIETEKAKLLAQAQEIAEFLGAQRG